MLNTRYQANHISVLYPLYVWITSTWRYGSEVSYQNTVCSLWTPTVGTSDSHLRHSGQPVGTSEARWNTSVNPDIPYGTSGEPDIHVDAILTQKFLHWGIFFSRQVWAQIRRTGVPKLIYPQASGSVNWAPDRWRYDESERYYNPNYPGFENDTYYDKLFWADPRGMRRSVYSNGVWTDQYGD